MATSGTLRNEYNQMSGQKNTYEKRKKELKSIRGNLTGRIDSDIDTVNQAMYQAGLNVESGLKGASSQSSLFSEISGLKQKYSNSDGYLNDILTNIDNEISRCDQKINDLSSKMRSKQKQINEAVAKERQEFLDSLKI